MTTIGAIKIGLKTQAHVEALRSLGYEPKQVGDHLHTPVSGFVEDLDLSEGLAPLKAVVEAKQALSYSTRVTFPDGKVLFAVPLCTRLGQLSCLVMKPVKAAKVKSTFTFADLMNS